MRITNQKIVDLANAALRLPNGSPRQIAAERKFFDAFHAAVGWETPEFDMWCLKATTDEMIHSALRILCLEELFDVQNRLNARN